ncbi:MAG: DotU family type IV/VI secretion system protein [Planctomycetaceae bacterium]|nr:DotU family type IV/VI secretion system protein [Planctomycetaceae bacterium]
MSLDLAQSVDPVFTHVLDLLEQIEAGEDLDPRRVQMQIRDLIEQADASVGATQSWELARYAITAWIDEVLLDAAWSGHEWWSNNVLEVELFRTRDCSEQFYVKAELARSLPNSQVLEVFYDCVVLGFRGIYRSAEIAQVIGRNDGLSESLEAWLRRTSLAIEKKSQITPRVVGLPSGAPPRTARRWFVGTGFLLLALVVIDVLIYQLRGTSS